MKCDHSGNQCYCICHKELNIIMHDHACCSSCLECGFKDPCSCERCYPYSIAQDVEHISNIIRKALNVNYPGDSKSEIENKLFNDEKEHIKNLYENILKEKCVELGIDPTTLKFDWNSMKWSDEK